MASIQKTARGYRAQVAVKGQRDSQTFAIRRDAVQWAANREAELRTGKTGSNKTLGEAITRFQEEECPKRKGERWEIIRLEAFRRDLPADKPLASIGPDVIAAWRDRRLKVVAGSTVLRDMKLLSSLFETARREWRWVDANPLRDITKPKSPPHRDRLYTWTEIRRILRALSHDRKVRTMTQATALAFLWSMRTGMRAKEICGLTRDDLKGEFATLRATKNGTRRDVPLPRKAQLLLNRIELGTTEVFGVEENTMSTLFRRARLKAGLYGCTFHDARHYAATALAKKLSLLELCRMFGWKDPKHALVYFNETASSIAKRL